MNVLLISIHDSRIPGAALMRLYDILPVFETTAEFREDRYIFNPTYFPDIGTILRTKVSKNPGQIRGHLWQEILKKQLKTTQERFNEVIWHPDFRKYFTDGLE